MSKSNSVTYLLRTGVFLAFALSGCLPWLGAVSFLHHVKTNGTRFESIYNFASIVLAMGFLPLLATGAFLGIIAVTWMARCRGSTEETR